MLQAVVSLAGTIDPSLGKALDDVTGKLENVNWKAVAVGGAVGGIAVATGKAVVEAGKYLADLGNEYNTAINQLSAATGATGDELDALGESVKNIYAQGLGDDFADVADGLAATQQASDLTGEALERATAAGFNLRDVFDYDVSESARAASALMKNFGIDAEEAYGLIAVGAQNGADKNGDLLDTLNEYSPQFAALGLSADQFIGTLVEGADAGLFSIDKVGDAVKEFNIRAKDGSDTSREAFESLGLNADKMFAAFAAGGDTAEAAFFDTVEALNSMDDPLARNAAGVALFGTQFEDLEAGVLPVLASIETAAYDGAAALQQINDVKYNDLGSAFEAIKRSAEVSLLPMASMIANTLTALAPILRETFEAIAPVITETLNACMPFVQQFLMGMGQALQTVLPMVSQLAAGLLPLLSQLISAFLPPLLELAQQLLPPLMQIVQAILPPIVSILTSILPMLTQIISTILPVLTSLISALLPVITPLLEVALQIVNSVIMPLVPPLMQIVQAILPPIVSILTSILPMLTQIISTILPVLTSLISALLPVITPLLEVALQIVNSVIMPLVPPLMQIVEALLPPLMSLLNAIMPILSPLLGLLQPIASVLGTIASVIGKIVSFGAGVINSIAGLFGGGGGGGASGFATGGFTSGPSIAGEDPRYPTEAVISFNPAYRAQNLSYWARAGEMLGAMDEGSYEPISSGSGTSVVYDLSGLSFSPTIKVDGNTDEDALIRKLRDLEPEFIDFILEALARREGGAYVTADSRLY
jgi:phage-related minor tail protein